MTPSYSAAMCSLTRLVHAHIPFDEAAHLALGIAARQHPLHELVMLALGLAVLLRFEGEDRQKILDLGEHPLFDHVPDLFVSGPGGVLAVVLGAVAERELHDL